MTKQWSEMFPASAVAQFAMATGGVEFAVDIVKAVMTGELTPDQATVAAVFSAAVATDKLLMDHVTLKSGDRVVVLSIEHDDVRQMPIGVLFPDDRLIDEVLSFDNGQQFDLVGGGEAVA